jgi:hypothetical protein
MAARDKGIGTQTRPPPAAVQSANALLCTRMFTDMDGRSAYDHLFNAGLSLSKIKDAALGGTLFHLDEACDLASTGVPGRSLAWKVQCSPFFPPYLASTDISICRSFLFRLILSTLSLNFHQTRRHTDVFWANHASNLRRCCLRKCALQTEATKKGLSRLAARNYQYAQFHLKIWSETIPLAYMMKFVRHLIPRMKRFWDLTMLTLGPL